MILAMILAMIQGGFTCSPAAFLFGMFVVLGVLILAVASRGLRRPR